MTRLAFQIAVVHCVCVGHFAFLINKDSIHDKVGTERKESKDHTFPVFDQLLINCTPLVHTYAQRSKEPHELLFGRR